MNPRFARRTRSRDTETTEIVRRDRSPVGPFDAPLLDLFTNNNPHNDDEGPALMPPLARLRPFG